MKIRYLFALVCGLLLFTALNPAPTHASSYSMGCFIDTPAWDQYRQNDCYQFGSTNSTASFKVFGPTPDQIIWSVPGCNSIHFCNVPISPGQNVTVTAQVIVNSQVVATVSATAHYFYEPGY